MQGIVESHAFIKAQLTYSLGLTKATYSKETDGKYYLSLAGKAVISCANKDSALDSTYTIRIDEIDTSFAISNDGTWIYEENPIESWAKGKEGASSLKLSLIDKNGNTMCEQTIPLTKSGTNPIVIEVSPEVILHKKSSTKKNYVITVRVHDGENLVSNENFSVAYSYPTDVSRAVQQSIDLRGATKRTETITVAANAEPDGDIGITVTYKGNTYTKSVQISTFADGEQGYQGPVYYCAGVWSADKEYTRTRDLCPYVIYNDGSGLTDENTQCYMLNTIVENYKSSTTPPNDSDHWMYVEKQELILTHMAVMDFASIGDVMFKGSFMFSKDGTTTTEGNSYLNFDDNDPDNAAKFLPNFYVNFKTGKSYQKNGVFNGSIYATDGSFTGDVYAKRGLFQGDVSIGDTNGQRVELRNKRLTFYNSSGKQISEHSSEEHNSLSQLVPSSTVAPNVSTTNMVSGTLSTGHYGGQGSNSDATVYLTDSFSPSTAGFLTINIDEVILRSYVTVSAGSTADGPSISVNFALVNSSGKVMYYFSSPLTHVGGTQGSDTDATYKDLSYTVAYAGGSSFRIAAFVSLTGSPTWNESHGFYGIKVKSVTSASKEFHSAFFGNGYILSYDTDDYFAVMLEGMNMRMSMSSGKYGLDVKSDGIMAKAKRGTLWHQQPIVLFAGRVSIYSSVVNLKTYVGSGVTATRISQGHCKLTFPSSWSDYNLDTNGYVMVTPIGTSSEVRMAASYELSDTSVELMIGDDRSPNDGLDMYVEIKVV